MDRGRNETTRGMVADLKRNGMPIAALADVLDAERGTVYSWLDGDARPAPAKYGRLELVSRLLAGESEGALRFFHRFWERGVPRGPSLKAALMADEIDADAVRAALDALRGPVDRSMLADANRWGCDAEDSHASSLTIRLVAGRGDGD